MGRPGPVRLSDLVLQNMEYVCDSHIAVEIPYELSLSFARFSRFESGSSCLPVNSNYVINYTTFDYN